MSEINKLIRDKLNSLPPEVKELAQKAIELSEAGLPDTSIAEQLQAISRQILKKRKGDSPNAID